MRIVLAPDSFKGTAEAGTVAHAIASGWADVRPSDEAVILPMADGGEGTLEALAQAPGAVRTPVAVTGPDGRKVEAEWLALPGDRGTVGVVELASTSGITLVERLAPLDAHTVGFGQAIAAALDAGVDSLLVAIGSSCSTDGGTGALAALGARFLGADGAVIARGGRGLGDLARADFAGLRPLPPGGASVLSDVTSPLLGDGGAAAVFGPQKGASPQQVRVLDAGLARLAQACRDAGRPVEPGLPGAGAAGGTGYGLAVWGATLGSGSAAVAHAIGLETALAGADLVITGEGAYDGQSDVGKVVSEVRRRAATVGIPVALVAGRIDADTGDLAAAVSLTDLAGGAEAAMCETLRWARAAGQRLAATFAP
ncbi:glycerate kinase [Demequina litorisediminis]|uniref:Glycerate kinase n=1 Tax=Demequina litorisediminis TaxID=1849022 RepID=A0ABQ6ICI3_9MICO|nr:glycerate kinase [Demequina litorisediminis]GMA34798.1 glycerate kinase [Demequina litorisediminis]